MSFQLFHFKLFSKRENLVYFTLVLRLRTKFWCLLTFLPSKVISSCCGNPQKGSMSQKLQGCACNGVARRRWRPQRPCKWPLTLSVKAIPGSDSSVHCPHCPEWLRRKALGAAYQAHCGACSTYHTTPLWLHYCAHWKPFALWLFSWGKNEMGYSSDF